MLQAIATGLLGEVLIDLGILGANVVDDALRKQWQLTQEELKGALTDPQQEVFDRICSEAPELCPIHEVLDKTNEMLAEETPASVLDGKIMQPKLAKVPRFGEVLRTIESIDSSVYPQIELASALQSVDRTFLLAQSMQKDGFDNNLLERAHQVLKRSPNLTLETVSPTNTIRDTSNDPYVSQDIRDMTQRAQAISNLTRLFVNTLEMVEKEEQGANIPAKNRLYNHVETQEAIKSAKALAYLQRQEIADHFRDLGKTQVADRLEKELREVRLPDIGEARSGLIPKLMRGITHTLHWMGYRKDGSERGMLGGVARSIEKSLEKYGYEINHQRSAQELVEGIEKGVEHLTTMNPPTLAKEVYSNLGNALKWMTEQATKAGMSAGEVEAFTQESQDLKTAYMHLLPEGPVVVHSAEKSMQNPDEPVVRNLPQVAQTQLNALTQQPSAGA